MIIQSAPAGFPRFVITNRQHSAFAAQMAQAFGNQAFDTIEPRAEMLFVIDHHDYGWLTVDECPAMDPATGLPYHLGSTPKEITVTTLVPAAEFNEAHHPYCGLLAAMHMWGLYTGRYGFSDRVVIDEMDSEHRMQFDEKLAELLKIQERLKRQLAGSPGTSGWVQKEHLFQNYRQLEFFDALALYFNSTSATERKSVTFKGVPQSTLKAVDVTVSPLDEAHYAFSPYPFTEDGITVCFGGRYLMQKERSVAEMRDALRQAPIEQQSVVFTSA